MSRCIDLENVQQHKRVFGTDILENLLDLTRDRRRGLLNDFVRQLVHMNANLTEPTENGDFAKTQDPIRHSSWACEMTCFP
jgi:hypothetical protein